MFAFLLSAAAASTAPAVPARGDLRALFTADDYPDAAVCMGQEGDVQAQLTVAPNGRVSECAIIRSSGFAALDSATCEAFRTRARFTPARDSSGKPVADQVVTPPVRWRLEGNELPLESWTLRLLVGLDKNGNPQMCSIQAGGALGRRIEPMTMECSYLSGAFTVPPELAKSFAGKPAVIIFDQQFVPRSVSTIETPRDLKKYALLSRDVLRFNIDSEGSVGSCARTASEGTYTPPTSGCEAIGSRRFKPDPKLQTTTLPATSTMAVYVYTK